MIYTFKKLELNELSCRNMNSFFFQTFLIDLDEHLTSKYNNSYVRSFSIL